MFIPTSDPSLDKAKHMHMCCHGMCGDTVQMLMLPATADLLLQMPEVLAYTRIHCHEKMHWRHTLLQTYYLTYILTTQMIHALSTPGSLSLILIFPTAWANCMDSDAPKSPLPNQWHRQTAVHALEKRSNMTAAFAMTAAVVDERNLLVISRYAGKGCGCMCLHAPAPACMLLPHAADKGSSSIPVPTITCLHSPILPCRQAGG